MKEPEKIEFEMRTFNSTSFLGSIANDMGLPQGDYILDGREASVLFTEVHYEYATDAFKSDAYSTKEEMLKSIEIIDRLDKYKSFFRELLYEMKKGRKEYENRCK